MINVADHCYSDFPPVRVAMRDVLWHRDVAGAGQSNHALGDFARSALREERTIEHMIGHASPLRNAFALVEGPMDAKVDPALTVLVLRLGQRIESPR